MGGKGKRETGRGGDGGADVGGWSKAAEGETGRDRRGRMRIYT